MDNGELCVLDHFNEMMPLLYASSLDTVQYDFIIMMIGKCEPEMYACANNLFICCNL